MDDDDLTRDSQAEQYEEIVNGRRKYSPLLRIAAVLVLVAFFALILPNLSFFSQGNLKFLNENGSLLQDGIVQKCRPAVVYIQTETVSGVTRQGTGFNVSPSGIIITNKHIVDDADLITIQFEDGRKYYSTSYEASEGDDIAVVSIDGEGLPALAVNREYWVKAGDNVTIIGNPLGYERIAQRGKVGGYHFAEGIDSQIFDIEIRVNPGNSGSPVINGNGEVVGIVFATSDKKALAIGAYSIEYLMEINGCLSYRILDSE